MSEENVDARPLTSVELLDAAVWREIDSDEAQPQAAFLEALSRLVGRWLMVRSDAPGMDVVTVLCKARGYIARQEVRQTTKRARMEKITRCYRYAIVPSSVQRKGLLRGKSNVKHQADAAFSRCVSPCTGLKAKPRPGTGMEQTL